MLREHEKFTAGQIVTASEGEYSGYQQLTDLEILVDFDYVEIGRKYLAEHPEQATGHSFEPNQFIVWLCVNGLAKEVQVRACEMHLGSYSMPPYCWDRERGE